MLNFNRAGGLFVDPERPYYFRPVRNQSPYVASAMIETVAIKDANGKVVCDYERSHKP